MAEFTQNAKQILRGKDHIADCVDAESAEMIVRAMNSSRDDWMTSASFKTVNKCPRTSTTAGEGDEAIGDSQPLPFVDQIAAYLDAQADKRARRRQFTQGIRFSAQEVRAGMWEQDEAAPEGVRARYNELNAPPEIECVPTVQEV